jgi:hypothetical protein
MRGCSADQNQTLDELIGGVESLFNIYFFYRLIIFIKGFLFADLKKLWGWKGRMTGRHTSPLF